ncbi:MAG: hypothetical protein OEQ53_19250, partial [Saprospiraceae bacterium]|nr:hypothetical protein [Saprospiraceae bacterium]
MKNLSMWLTLLFLPLYALTNAHNGVAEGFTNGTPDIKSMHSITFGPDGILFIGDSKSAMVFAIDTKDVMASVDVEDVEVKKIDELIATSLGTEVDNIIIQDLAINPLSKRVYLAVHHVDGSPILFTIESGDLQVVDLTDVSFSKMALTSPVEESATDRRGRSLRKWAISDIDYFDGRVLVSGLSNKEFSSALTMLPFPFRE